MRHGSVLVAVLLIFLASLFILIRLMTLLSIRLYGHP